MILKPAKGKLTTKPALEILPGDNIPDGNGLLHEVTAVNIKQGQIVITLSDGQVNSFRPATSLYCLKLFGG